jgi:hypothetical protein
MVQVMMLPAWRDVENREYEDSSQDRIIIDTAKKSERDCFQVLLAALDLADKTR